MNEGSPVNWSPSAQVVRHWVELYTRGLPDAVRSERRDEIDADLWSQTTESVNAMLSQRSLAIEIMVRLMLGIPSDLNWRFEHLIDIRLAETRLVDPTIHLRGSAVLALLGGIGWTGLGLLLLSGLWGYWSEETTTWISMNLFMLATWALAGAVVVSILTFADVIRAPVVLIATVGASIGALGALGAYIGIVALPIASGVTAWQLSRIGVFSPTLSRIHIVASAATAVLLARVVVDYNFQGLWYVLAAGIMSYGISWIALGWSIRHGVSLVTTESRA
jgi:hypothetical protein